MFSIVIAVFVISSIGAGLAAVLVLAERFIADYGQCQIDVNGEKNLTAQGGSALLYILTTEKIFIPSACGGRGTCGLCKLKITSGAGALLPTEMPFLSTEEQKTDIRLSCQVKVRGDLCIEIPQELFAIKQYDCVCVEITDLTHDMKRFRFELRDPAAMDFAAGQYIQLLCPRYKGNPEEVYRAYSISSNPAQKHTIELIIKRVPGGICTTYCFDHLKVGDTVELNGPYGDFRLSDSDGPVVFVAGGSGMAPFVSILYYMVEAGIDRDTTYFFGGRNAGDIFLVDLMKHFESILENFCFVPVVAEPVKGNNWFGETGLVTEALARHLTTTDGYEAYLCGSPGLINAATRVLTDRGMGVDKIYYDKFE
ncbi:MAG: FAD-binding oxidoreductase [Planctomycetota bacterium]|jgi:Na+-transporting NADH:ubiquinone oxidoreductase subunit F